MVKFGKKTIVVTLVALIFAAAGILFLVNINKEDARRQRAQEQEANSIGLLKAKSECIKAGIDPGACSNLTAVTSSTECDGKMCWSVYAQVDEPDYFGASVLVELKDGQYIATNYIRNTAE